MSRSHLRLWGGAVLAAAVTLVAGVSGASAESVTVRIARQFGVSYLPLTIMEQKQLLEQEGKALGLDIKTEGCSSRAERR